MAQTIDIVMFKTRAGPEGVWPAGQRIPVPAKRGRQLIEAGYARPAQATDPRPRETATAEPEGERAMEEEPEARKTTARAPAQQTRKGKARTGNARKGKARKG